MTQRFLVLGAGRYGQHLAASLSSFGCEVVICDHDAKRVQDLSELGFHAVRLDADEAGDLREAGAVDADAVIVAIGENMQASILCTLLLKELGTKMVVARAVNDKHGQILSKVGADLIVTPFEESAQRLAERLRDSASGDRLPLAGEYQVAKVRLGPQLAGQALDTALIHGQHGVRVILISRGADSANLDHIEPGPDVVLEEGDLLFVAGERARINRFEQQYGR